MVKVLTPLPVIDSVCPLTLALIAPWLMIVALPPIKLCPPIVPRPCTVTPAPSVKVPAASLFRKPEVVALPRLMVALLKLCVP